MLYGVVVMVFLVGLIGLGFVGCFGIVGVYNSGDEVVNGLCLGVEVIFEVYVGVMFDQKWIYYILGVCFKDIIVMKFDINIFLMIGVFNGWDEFWVIVGFIK